MANNLAEFSLLFKADTRLAYRDVLKLSKSLSDLNKGINFTGNTTYIKEASLAALDLQSNLRAAFNPQTLQLNLSRFNLEMKASGLTLATYADRLDSLGPAGRLTFDLLTRSIAQTSTPVITLTGKLQRLFATFGNAVRWRMTTAAIGAVTGAISGAMQYAQELNKSLNNIRIVTGNSADEMARFALYANKAAKELSTTTTAYTDAALIFYQQGLGDDEVKARTETTLKLSNVTGESVSEISSLLTAIWNNFADGSTNLERYADIITALGAATASSSKEISDGLLKFAAIGNTVGLSYEYATTALATVVATTRESAETVGTSFKTLFGRMQSLKQGETLDDGTTLTKYSDALAKVGVAVKDENDQLRAMDDILDDVGARWGELDKAQRVALASTVGGIRQYLQFIALMDNWDMFKKNLSIANTADGTLEKQQKIYAESWEAARKQVQASAQGLFDDLINDKFFIQLTTFGSKLIDFIDTIVDGLGGVKGAILLIGSVLTQVFANKMPTIWQNVVDGFRVVTGRAKKDTLALQELAAHEEEVLGISSRSVADLIHHEGRLQELELRRQITAEAERMTDKEKLDAELLFERLQKHNEQREVLALEVDEYIKMEREAKKQLATTEEVSAEYEALRQTLRELKLLKQRGFDSRTLDNQVANANALQDELAKTNNFKSYAKNIKINSSKPITDTISATLAEIDRLSGYGDKLPNVWKGQETALQALIDKLKEYKAALEDIRQRQQSVDYIENGTKVESEASKEINDGSAGKYTEHFAKQAEEKAKEYRNKVKQAEDAGLDYRVKMYQKEAEEYKKLLNAIHDGALLNALQVRSLEKLKAESIEEGTLEYVKQTAAVKGIDQALAVMEDTVGAAEVTMRSRAEATLLAIDDFRVNTTNVKPELETLKAALNDPDATPDILEEALSNLMLRLEELAEEGTNEVEKYAEKTGQDFDEVKAKADALAESQAGIIRNQILLNNSKPNVDPPLTKPDTVAQISKAASAYMSLAMVTLSVSNALETLTNSEASAEDKLKTIITTIPMAIMGVTRFISSLKAALAAGETLTVSLGWIGLILAAVGAAAMGAIKLYLHLTENNITVAEAADKAKESLERLSGALDTLNSSYDNYKDIAAGINLCTQGTDEWYQKTVELLNAQAKLTADNPTLANIVKNPEAYGLNPDEIYEEVNGVMVYTDKVIKAALTELLKNNKIALESAAITEAVANVPEVVNDLKNAQLNYATLYTDATGMSLAYYELIDPNVQLYDLMEKLNFEQLNELSSASSDMLSDKLNEMLIGILSEQYAGYENLTFGREATTDGASFLQGFFDLITEGELKEIVSYFRQRGANYLLKGYGTTDAQLRYWMYNLDAADTLYNNAKEWVNENKDDLKNTSEYRNRLASYFGLSPDEVTSKDISFGDNTIVVKGQNLDYGAAVQLIRPELFAGWKQGINNEFDQLLKGLSPGLLKLFNVGGDWTQLSIGDLISLKETRMFTDDQKAFFRQNGLDLDSIIDGIRNSSIKNMRFGGTNPQRYKTYLFLKENGLNLSESDLSEKQLDALADVDAQLLTASNNVDYIAKALEMSAEDLPPVIKTWASNIATSVDGAATLLGKDFNNMIGIVEEAASGEAIKDADFQSLEKLFPDKELSDYFRFDDKTEKWTLLNTASAKAFATELRNVAAAAALSGNDITKAKRVYNSFGKTLELVNSLHGLMAGIMGEELAYELARTDAIGNELDNLKVSYTEYNQIIKDIQEHNGKALPFVDEIALAVIKLGQSRESLEKTWKQFQKSKLPGVAGQIGDSLAEIFGITDLSVKDKFTEDITNGNFTNEILIALTPNADPKEFAKALSKIQLQLQFYKLEAYISKDVNGLKGLTDELNAWKEKNSDLSITALINSDQFTEKLKEMLRNGTITYNTLQAMFSALGGELKTSYQRADGSEISASEMKHYEWAYNFSTANKQKYPTFDDYLASRADIKTVFNFTPTEVTELFPDPDDTTGSTPSATEHKITAYKDKIATVDASISRLKDTISDTTEEINKLKNALTDDNTYDAPEYLEAYVSALESWKTIRQDIIDEYNGKQNIIGTELTADSESFQKLLKELGTGITLGLYLLDNGLYDESELKKAFDAAFNTQVDKAAYNSLDGDVKKKFDEAERLMNNIFSESQDLYANQRELTKYIQESNAAIIEYAKVAEKAYSQTFENNVKRLNNKLKDNEVITKQLTRETSKANKEYSKAYGQDKIVKAEQLQQVQAKENEQLKKTADLYEELRTVNRNELNDLMTRSGLLLDIEEADGYIVNSEFLIAELEAEITKLTNEINIGKRNGIALTAEEILAEAERLAILERINDIISKNNEYRDSEYDALDKISENEDSIANLKYLMIIDKLNQQIKLSENELKLLDYDFKVLSSNFYTMGEAAALFLDKGDELVGRLDDYEDAFNELEASAKKGEIALSDYGEGLQQVFDGLLDTLGSIEDLTQEVKGYYGLTLQAGKAELDNYTKSLVRATATLNHYKTLLGLLGREADYDALGKIYEGLIKTTKNEYDTAKNWYELTKAQTEELYEQMLQYDKTSKAYEVLHQSWMDGLNEMDSAYSDMMSKFEAYNQAILDNYKNTLEKMARELEKSLTNNTTFDSLTKKLERMKGLDEEYLTKTNQIYELSKLAREAQKELDKNDNALSQQKLRNFIKETDALKNQNKFSNLELEIQKAKYEVMMAQMALDDAQMAKSKVRLQRNSEGGYGYVYTADSNAVDDAILKYEDAQNRLYNIGLENAEQYTEQILLLMLEGTEQIKKVLEDYDNGLIGSLAEKEALMNEISLYYLERIRQAEELYGIAMNRTNEHVREDTWTTLATMLASGEEFYTQTQKYMEDTSRAWIEYHNQMDEASKLVGEDTASVANNVAQITSDSDETAELIKNDIMPGIEKVTTEAEKTAIQFAAWAKNVEGTIDHARELATEILGIMRSLSGIDNASAEELAGLDKTAYDRNTDYSLEIAGRIYELKKLDQNSQEYLDKMAEIERLKLLRNAKMAGEGITGVQETESLTADLLEESLTYLNRYLRESEMSGRYGHFTMPQFDTGGYTGSWGSNGRIAMLHEKELVLNAEDTKNILSATEIVRKLASMFALPAFGFSAATMRNTNNGFELNVHIDASFPNVQDHNEVEIAIQNLINTASQYVMGR